MDHIHILIFDTTQYHVHQSREGEKGDLSSDVDISSRERNTFPAPISFTLGLLDLSFNNSWLRAERYAEEKDLARFFSS